MLSLLRNAQLPVPGISTYALAALAVLLIQFVFLSQSFPLGELFSALPLTVVDHAFHQFQTFLALDLARQGQLTGYDTHFAAGYVGGVTLNVSAKFPALAAWLLHGVLNPVITYKLYVFLSALVAPLCLPLAARLLLLDSLTTWIAALLGLSMWWASAFHWYHTVGMVSYVLIAYLTIPYCAGIYRALQGKHQWWQSILLGVFGAAAFFLHPFFPVSIAIFVVMLHVFYRDEFPLKRSVLPLSVIAVSALLPNLIWLVAMLSAPSFANGGFTAPYQQTVDPMIMWWEITGQWHAHAMGAKIYTLLAVLAVIGGWFGAKGEFIRTSLGVWAVLVLFSALGASLPFLAPLQPNRFSMMGYLYLVLPASMGLASLLRLVVSRGWHPGFAVVPIIVLLPFSALVAKEFVHEVSSIPSGRYGRPPPEVQGLGANNKALLQWITDHTSKRGRILFETSSGRIHDGAHISGLLAYLSHREFIGGPYPHLFFAGFWDGYVFGKPIQSIDETAFMRYLDIYNIGWVMAHSPASIAYLNSQPALKQVTQIGGVHVYQAKRPLTYFLAGEGSVEVDNLALVVRVADVSKPIVLSYHYIPGLNADDGSVITPVYIADDPQPFIKLAPRSNTVVLCDTHPCRDALLNQSVVYHSGQ